MRWQNILYNHILWKVTYLHCQNNLQFCGTVFVYRHIFIIAFVFIFTQYASCMLTLSPVLWPPDKDRWPDRTNTLHLLESRYWTCPYFFLIFIDHTLKTYAAEFWYHTSCFVNTHLGARVLISRLLPKIMHVQCTLYTLLCSNEISSNIIVRLFISKWLCFITTLITLDDLLNWV